MSDAKYKDAHPQKTIEKIKEILAAHSIETEEIWLSSGVPHCYACTIKVKGTTFSVNGKGLSEDFARASGYGELMERLQLGFVGSRYLQKSGQSLDSGDTGTHIDAQNLLQENKAWYDTLAEKLYRYSGVRMDAGEILTQYADAGGKVGVHSYYNLTRKKQEYFPTPIVSSAYSSNGCAAGNTMEEAVVQAISEIVERYHKTEILLNAPALPDIPEEVLQQFPYAYSIITYLRQQGFRVCIKDCSLGQKFPVVCAIHVDTKTGRYHVHFGAAPVLEIAVNRTLTETFQGRNIGSFTKYDSFVYRSAGNLDLKSLYRELRVGEAEKPPQFFIREADRPWNSAMGFTGSNNRELFREVVRYFADMGYDVLVRNGSCLGFPTCQVLIPGYSESLAHNLSLKHNPFRYAPHAAKALRNPSQAKLEDYMGMLQHLKKMDTEFPIDGLGFKTASRLCTELTADEDAFLLAASLGYVCYALGRNRDVADCLDKMLRHASEAQLEALICLKRYFTMKVNRCDEETVEKTLRFFHRPETVDALYATVNSGENPFDAYTLHCGTAPCESCPIFENCSQNTENRLLTLCREKREKLDFDEFAHSLQALLD